MNRRQLFAAFIAWVASLLWKPPTKLRILSCSSPIPDGKPWVKIRNIGSIQYSGYHFIGFDELEWHELSNVDQQGILKRRLFQLRGSNA